MWIVQRTINATRGRYQREKDKTMFGQYSSEHTQDGPQMPLSVSRKASHTRTRTVFPSHELPHIWAHQSAPLGRCSSSMSFDGAEFYSYGTTIGEIVKTKRGEIVYLVSDSTYSVTTSGHQGKMLQAIPTTALKITIPGVSRGYDSGFGDPKRIMDKWRDRITHTLQAAATSRRPKNVRLVSEAVSIAQQMRNYGKLMGAKTGHIPRIPTSPDEIAKFACCMPADNATSESV